MNSRVLLLAGLAIAFSPFPNVLAQGIGRQPGLRPALDPWARRLIRERAVLHAGPGARAFVESEAYGDEAALSLLMCSRMVSMQLASFHGHGGFELLHRPKELLHAIAQPSGRDAVAMWVMQHAGELTDPEYADVFLTSPLEFALGLRQLHAAVMERHPAREEWSLLPYGRTVGQTAGIKPLVLLAGLIAIIGLLIWRKRRQLARDAPA